MSGENFAPNQEGYRQLDRRPHFDKIKRVVTQTPDPHTKHITHKNFVKKFAEHGFFAGVVDKIRVMAAAVCREKNPRIRSRGGSSSHARKPAFQDYRRNIQHGTDVCGHDAFCQL